MIDKHMYPKNFFFAVTKEGIDGRRSLLVEGGHHRRRSSTILQTKESRRRASTLEGQPADTNDKTATGAASSGVRTESSGKKSVDTDMADLTGAMSALQFVPQKVRFGKGRAGFSKT